MIGRYPDQKVRMKYEIVNIIKVRTETLTKHSTKTQEHGYPWNKLPSNQYSDVYEVNLVTENVILLGFIVLEIMISEASHQMVSSCVEVQGDASTVFG